MKSRGVVYSGIALAVGLATYGATVFAAGGGHGEHEEHALGAHTIVLSVPADASDADRLQILQADFRRRVHRIDWKSDSVVKRIRWALRDAEKALDAGDADTATRRLDDAQALLERY